MARVLIAVLLTCVLALSGCSDDGSGAEVPDETSAAPTSDAPTSEPTSEATSGTAGVAPATGEEIDLDGMSLRLPADFVAKDVRDIGFTAVREGRLPYDTFQGRIQDNLGITSTLAQTIALRNDLQLFYLRDPKVLAPVVIDGLKMFHLSGKVSDVLYAEAYGSDLGDHVIDLSFLFGPGTTPAERREVVGSVLATVDLD